MEKYASARLKIDRAKHHISDFQNRIANIPDEEHRTVVDYDSRPGKTLIKFVTESIKVETSLIFGDAITNLRSALDHAFAAAIGCQNDTTGQVYFPIRENLKGLENALKKTAEKNPIPKPLWELIVNEIQPHEGGHPALSALNKLANIDKHRLIISLSGVTTITGQLIIGTSRVSGTYTQAKTGQETNIFEFPTGTKFEGKLYSTIEVSIGEAGVSYFKAPVVETLLGFADDVAIVVSEIERVCP